MLFPTLDSKVLNIDVTSSFSRNPSIDNSDCRSIVFVPAMMAKSIAKAAAIAMIKFDFVEWLIDLCNCKGSSDSDDKVQLVGR